MGRVTSEQHTIPPTPLRIDDHHRAILQALDEVKEKRTGKVARDAGFVGHGPGTIVASLSCRLWLIEMEGAGLVMRVARRRGVAWLRGLMGTSVLGLMR